MSLSRRDLVKLTLGIPIVGVGIIAYSLNKETDKLDFDSCIVAHLMILTPEVSVGNQALISTLVINRSREEKECNIDLVVDNYVVDTKKVSIPPLDFSYVNMSFNPNKEGLYVLDVAGFQDILVAKTLPPPSPPSTEISEELKKKFESLVSDKIAKYEQIIIDNKIYYKGFDEHGNLLAYLFQIPVQGPTDRLVVTAAISIDYKVIAIDVEPAPSSEHLFNPDIATSKFENQFKGLTINDLALKPNGKIDAVTMATYSSKAVVDAVRYYLELLVKK